MFNYSKKEKYRNYRKENSQCKVICSVNRDWALQKIVKCFHAYDEAG